MKIWILVLTCLVGCEGNRGTPVVPEAAKSDFKLELIFKVEGCSVYRFHDGYDRYLTTCPGSIESQIRCGKGCTRPDVNSTTKEHK